MGRWVGFGFGFLGVVVVCLCFFQIGSLPYCIGCRWQSYGSEGSAGVASEKKSGALQQTHYRTQLCPSAKMWHLWGNVFQKGQDAAQQ